VGGGDIDEIGWNLVCVSTSDSNQNCADIDCLRSLSKFQQALCYREAHYAYPALRALNAIYSRFSSHIPERSKIKKAPTLSRPLKGKRQLLLQKRKQIRVHDVESAVGFALLNDARDIDLTGTLRDHLDIDALLPQRAEEAPADADHAA
jgi:hypothetical protein